MKRINWIITLGATVVALVAPSAEATIFTDAYEGNALPTASSPAWTKALDIPTTSESVSGGILTVSTSPNTGTLVYRLLGGTGLDWDPTALGSTVELRLKTDSQVASTAGAGSIVILTGSQGWVMSFGTNQITEVGVGGGTVSMDTSDAFHVYRFTMAGTSGPLNLYVDGNDTAVMSWVGGATGANRLDFGDNLDQEGGQVQWDYIRWTNQGAFAPVVPEPSLLALLSLGWATIWRDRRKR